VVFILVLILAGEVGARLFWSIKYHRPLIGKPELFYSFYPELKPLQRLTKPGRGNRLDVLILGGSVISNAWGNVSTVLSEELSLRSDRNIGVVNLARPAHTKLDSYIKYARVTYPFQVVAIYHGINDARTNNCPPEIFRSDYSHYSWYHDVNSLLNHSESEYIVLPYTLGMLFSRIRERTGARVVLPTARPPQRWLDYGYDIKSAGPYRRNLERIIELAKLRNQRVILMTFAFFKPENYSSEAFRKRSLPYALHSAALEAWGEPEAVAKAVETHNDIIRTTARTDSTLLFLDAASVIPHEKGYFNDACHLTGRGCVLLGEAMANMIADSSD
jgi:hypothetical protein